MERGQGHLRQRGAIWEGFLREGVAKLRLKGEEELGEQWKAGGRAAPRVAQAQRAAPADF